MVCRVGMMEVRPKRKTTKQLIPDCSAKLVSRLKLCRIIETGTLRLLCLRELNVNLVATEIA